MFSVDIDFINLGSRLSLYRPGDLCLSGEEVERISVEQLMSVVRNVTVFYRSGPKHKCKIVKVTNYPIIYKMYIILSILLFLVGISLFLHCM